MTSNSQFKCNKVMVIDDNKIDLFIINKIIERTYFSKEVLTCQSAKEALDHLSNQNIIAEEVPSVIFLDINMPEMNGFEFLDAFAQLNSTLINNIAVIMLTSSQNPEDIQKANDNPYVVFYLHKPLTIAKLDAIDVASLTKAKSASLFSV